MDKTKKLSPMNVFAIFCFVMFASCFGWCNAAIAKYAAAFPDVAMTSIRQVGTLPSLVGMIVMIVGGPIIGTKIKYKPVVVTAMLCILVGGLAPYFLHNWTAILVCRAILGIGAGLLGVRNAIIMKSVDPAKTSAYIGVGAALISGISLVASPIVGWLADKAWNYSFLFYVLAAVGLIIVLLFFKEPEQTEAEKNAEKKPINLKINPKVYVICILQMIVCGALYPVLTGMATYLTSRGIGSAAVAGTIISMYTLGGFISSLLLGPIHKAAFKQTITICTAIGAIALAVILKGAGLVVVGAMVFLCGAQYMVCMSTFQKSAAMVAGSEGMSTAVMLIGAAAQIGIFLSSYWINFSHKVFNLATDAESSFLTCLILYVAISIFSFFFWKKSVPEE